jgi:hypothetical protein
MASTTAQWNRLNSHMMNPPSEQGGMPGEGHFQAD